MNKKNSPNSKSSSIHVSHKDDEIFVRNFLLNNDDFFKKNKDLITKLNFPHEDIGDSNSLLERQNTKLKKNLNNYERQFSSLLDAAEFNEKIYVKLINWLVVLIKSKKIGINPKHFIELLVVSFELRLAGITLFNEDLDFKKELLKYELKVNHPLYSIMKRLSETTFKQIPSKESDVWLDYFNSEGVLLRLKQNETKSKVSDLKIQSGSMVVIPLRNPDLANDILGNLIIISDDKEKFENNKGVVFLDSIAQILSSTIIKKLEKR